MTDPAFRFSGLGAFIADDVEYDADLSVEIAPDGRAVVLASLPFDDDSRALYEVTLSKSLLLPSFGLRLTTDEGVEVLSDHLTLRDVATPSDDAGSLIRATTEAYLLDVSWPDLPSRESVSGPDVRVNYFIPGARGFGPMIRVDTEFGLLDYGAHHEVEDLGEISGQLLLTPSGELRLEDADRFVDRVLEVLSFALGHRVRWTAREIWLPEKRVHLRLAPLASAPEPGFPVMHFLHMEPALRLGVEYASRGPSEEDIGIAISWLLMRPRYREAELLTLMTALEHLVSASEAAKGLTWVEKKVFKGVVVPELEHTLEKSEIEPDAREELRERLHLLNRVPFFDRLSAMLAAEEVPLVALSEPDLRAALRIRNRIVHAGARPRSASSRALVDGLAVLRELLVRIVLNRLGYEGQYQSHLDTVEFRDFPPPS